MILASTLEAYAAVKPVEDRSSEILILVVDDSRVDLWVAAHLLKRRPATKVVTAADGRLALTVIENLRPDLVITDLEMPEMNGLELVETIRDRFPYLPTVLMTAHGSEQIAMRALKSGAASYVRKQDSTERLIDTIDEVLALTAGKRQQHRLRPAWQQTEFQLCLENDPALISVLVAHLREYLSSLAYYDETTFFHMGIALHEALTNAMLHGNLELDSALREVDSTEYYRLASERRNQAPYSSRRVHVRLRETAHFSCYVIRDEGPGFDVVANRPDPTDSANLLRVSGRGLFLIHTFMDEVSFNDAGNEITMVHYRPHGVE